MSVAFDSWKAHQEACAVCFKAGGYKERSCDVGAFLWDLVVNGKLPRLPGDRRR